MQKQKTFTLIEMLIVVVIIGILAAALIPRLQNTQAKTRDVIRKKDIKTAADALAIYYQDNQAFPCPHPPADPNSTWNTAEACAEGSDQEDVKQSGGILSSLVPRYISKPFMDTRKGGYRYFLYSTGDRNNIYTTCNMSYIPLGIVQLLYYPENRQPTDWFRSCPDGRPFETINKICGWGENGDENKCFEAGTFPGKYRMRGMRIFDDKVMAVGDKYNVYPQ